MTRGRPHSQRAAVFAACACTVALASTAGSPVRADPPAPATAKVAPPPDDRASTQSLLQQASATPATADAVARANEAIEQAKRFRAAGDEAHAKAADGLAREWAETARDLALAVAAEKAAEDCKRQSMDSQAQLQRTRALVEEGIAHLGRLRAELATAHALAHAVEAHDGEAKPAASKAQAAAATVRGATP